LELEHWQQSFSVEADTQDQARNLPGGQEDHGDD